MPKIVFEAIKKNFSRDGEHGWNVRIDGVDHGKIYNRDFDVGTNIMGQILAAAGVELEFDFETGESDAKRIYDNIYEKMQTALKMFGEYTFMDKGPQESMDIDLIVEMLRDNDAEDVIKALLELSSDKFGERLVSTLLIEMQD